VYRSEQGHRRAAVHFPWGVTNDSSGGRCVAKEPAGSVLSLARKPAASELPREVFVVIDKCSRAFAMTRNGRIRIQGSPPQIQHNKLARSSQWGGQACRPRDKCRPRYVQWRDLGEIRRTGRRGRLRAKPRAAAIIEIPRHVPGGGDKNGIFEFSRDGLREATAGD
jgi:hypothetical protein